MAVLKSPRNNKNKVKWAQSYASTRPKVTPVPQLRQRPRANACWHKSFNSNYENFVHPLTDDQPLAPTSALNFKLHKRVSFQDSTNTTRTPFTNHFNERRHKARVLDPFTFVKLL